MTHKNPAIILIDPQLGENIGMVARAMLNCGFTDLRLVRPRDGWPSEHATRASSGALDKGVVVTLFDTTSAAIADCHRVYATTARPRDMTKNVYTARSAMVEAHEKENEIIGILFGAERSGLQNEDIALANGIITLPLNPEFTSLNLAQAVLLVTYEYLMQGDDTPDTQVATNLANKDTINQFSDRLIDTLDDNKFFRSEDLRPTTQRNLRNMLSRMEWTDQDIKTLHGIVSALTKN
ncbi:MAG: rRNA methyltransferase [Alphaproteobacteria bacterium]|nr:MAG: rRNA methyltransferase [Alphaproteobacteria bacterium]